MFKVVLLQTVAILLAAVPAWLLVGRNGAVSAALGGATVVIPNLFFALSLWVATRGGRTSAARFFVGEFIKIAATLALLVIVAGEYRDLHWLAFLAGLIVTLKANLFAFLLKT